MLLRMAAAAARASSAALAAAAPCSARVALATLQPAPLRARRRRGLSGAADGGGERAVTPQDRAVHEMIHAASERVPFAVPEDTVKLHTGGECVFIDVREPPEWFGTGMVKKAVPIPRGVIEFTAPDRIPADVRVVIYCSNGVRAALAGATMLDMGYTDVINGGSFEALADAGIPTQAPVTTEEAEGGTRPRN